MSSRVAGVCGLMGGAPSPVVFTKPTKQDIVCCKLCPVCWVVAGHQWLYCCMSGLEAQSAAEAVTAGAGCSIGQHWVRRGRGTC